jgi:hypothetical protein
MAAGSAAAGSAAATAVGSAEAMAAGSAEAMAAGSAEAMAAGSVVAGWAAGAAAALGKREASTATCCGRGQDRRGRCFRLGCNASAGLHGQVRRWHSQAKGSDGLRTRF